MCKEIKCSFCGKSFDPWANMLKEKNIWFGQLINISKSGWASSDSVESYEITVKVYHEQATSELLDLLKNTPTNHKGNVLVGFESTAELILWPKKKNVYIIKEGNNG